MKLFSALKDKFINILDQENCDPPSGVELFPG